MCYHSLSMFDVVVEHVIVLLRVYMCYNSFMLKHEQDIYVWHQQVGMYYLESRYF